MRNSLPESIRNLSTIAAIQGRRIGNQATGETAFWRWRIVYIRRNVREELGDIDGFPRHIRTMTLVRL